MPSFQYTLLKPEFHLDETFNLASMGSPSPLSYLSRVPLLYPIHYDFSEFPSTTFPTQNDQVHIW